MRYPSDILADESSTSRQPTYPLVDADVGMEVEDRASGFRGVIVKTTAEAVTLRRADQHVRHFGWKPGGFLVAGRPTTLRRPAPAPGERTPRVTASGSVAGEAQRARVAVASRIWVEGRHDAELLELVWGDDLRELGIVVEPMHGADDLAAAVRAFAPAPHRRLGVLLDHLVPGSKESRLAAEVERHADGAGGGHVLIDGHPFVDVWAGVRPSVVGLAEWPEVPRSELPWKEALCRQLGVRFDGFWPRLRNSVHSYADLRPELVGAVERLIDFVTET